MAIGPSAQLEMARSRAESSEKDGLRLVVETRGPSALQQDGSSLGGRAERSARCGKLRGPSAAARGLDAAARDGSKKCSLGKNSSYMS